MKKYGYVVGRVGRIFLYLEEWKDIVFFEFDVDLFVFDMENEFVMGMYKFIK